MWYRCRRRGGLNWGIWTEASEFFTTMPEHEYQFTTVDPFHPFEPGLFYFRAGSQGHSVHYFTKPPTEDWVRIP